MKFQIQTDLAGVLRRARGQDFSFQKSLLELIDNSVDERADQISVTELDGDLIIEDNGGGFSDIGSALVVGKSSKVNSIGRYGVGLKDACVRWSKSTRIESRGVGVTAPWSQIIAGASDGSIDADQINDDGLTRVILEEFSYSRSIQTNEIRKVYAPLLTNEEVWIHVNGVTLTALPFPDFYEEIEEEFEFRGKVVRIHGGLFQPSDSARGDWAGYNPYYMGRLIGPGKIMNAGVGSEGCTNFSFSLHLIDGDEDWSLATNKDAVGELEDLLAHCYDTYTRELLIKGAAATREIELKEMEESITKSLVDSGNITRKGTAGKRGSVKPVGSGSKKINTSTNTTKGEYRPRRKPYGGSGLAFRFSRLGGDGLGQIQDQGKLVIIEANLDNSFVWENRDSEPVILLLAKMCYAMNNRLSSNDMWASEISSDIMNKAGLELC